MNQWRHHQRNLSFIHSAFSSVMFRWFKSSTGCGSEWRWSMNFKMSIICIFLLFDFDKAEVMISLFISQWKCHFKYEEHDDLIHIHSVVLFSKTRRTFSMKIKRYFIEFKCLLQKRKASSFKSWSIHSRWSYSQILRFRAKSLLEEEKMNFFFFLRSIVSLSQQNLDWKAEDVRK